MIRESYYKKKDPVFNKIDSIGKKQGLWQENGAWSYYYDGQKIHADINKTDSTGKKHGLWVIEYSEDGKSRSEKQYKNGVLSGKYRSFNSEGVLYFEGEYIDGKVSWYSFNTGDKVNMIYDSITENQDSITREGDKKRVVPKYKCYSKSYQDNGNIEYEGWLLYYDGDSPVIYSIEYGKWKYYNEKGELIEEKEFKP